MVNLVDSLPRMHKALGLIPPIAINKELKLFWKYGFLSQGLSLYSRLALNL